MRRRCGLSAAGVDALPWWEYELLIEGLSDELSGETAGQSESLDEMGVTMRTAG